MPRIAYVNGRYVPHQEAMVHVDDRGYQFADGVYEVCEVRGGRLVDERLHLERLARSLRELRIPEPMSTNSLGVVMRETVRRNRVRDGVIYLQVTRGVAPRDHGFPAEGTRPGIVASARSHDLDRNEEMATAGIGVLTVPETRWARVDIKSVALLPNVLAKQAARDAGAKEAWFVTPDGKVTEGASSNAWIVSAEGKLVTHQLGNTILRGVTRTVLLKLLADRGLELDERPFTVDEAYAAREAFITSASQIVMPVVAIDGRPVGNGSPGLLTTELRREFHRFAEAG